jgi:folate-binding Fe-S cluster repair protein YgfZ
MNKSWQVWVDENHGYVGQDGLLQFPDLFGQVAAVRSGNALAVLDGFALIRLEGEDAESFLQGQLSGDIREVGAEARFTTYSTAKGRMLASFLVWQQQAAYYLMVSADICQAIAKRLTMFVMRSKVKVTVLNGAETGLLGVRGAQLEAVIAQYFAKPAASPLACWNKMPMWPLHCLKVVSSSI